MYVPTNHLYLGDVVVCPPERASFPDLSVEEGIRVFLTGGMGLPEHRGRRRRRKTRSDRRRDPTTGEMDGYRRTATTAMAG